MKKKTCCSLEISRDGKKLSDSSLFLQLKFQGRQRSIRKVTNYLGPILLAISKFLRFSHGEVVLENLLVLKAAR